MYTYLIHECAGDHLEVGVPGTLYIPPQKLIYTLSIVTIYLSVFLLPWEHFYSWLPYEV